MACCTPLRASASDSSDKDEQAMKDEARLEALERGVRRKQGLCPCVTIICRGMEATLCDVAEDRVPKGSSYV